jgi:hypothetical protein
MGRTAIYKGQEITMKFIGEAVLRMVDAGWDILKEKLMLGVHVDFGSVFPKALHKKSVGTNFSALSGGRGLLDDPNLGLEGFKSEFWRVLDRRRDLCRQFLKTTGEALVDMEWVRGSILEWCSAFDKLQDICLVAVHLSAGMPARATELSELTLRSGFMTSFSLFLSAEGDLGIHQQYHKMRNVTCRNANVTRYLPPKVANLFMAMLVFCRDVYM